MLIGAGVQMFVCFCLFLFLLLRSVPFLQNAAEMQAAVAAAMAPVVNFAAGPAGLVPMVRKRRDYSGHHFSCVSQWAPRRRTRAVCCALVGAGALSDVDGWCL